MPGLGRGSVTLACPMAVLSLGVPPHWSLVLTIPTEEGLRGGGEAWQNSPHGPPLLALTSTCAAHRWGPGLALPS